MDYESIDREMSMYCVSCRKNGTKFFLTEDEMASDMPEHAARFKTWETASKAAKKIGMEKAWHGFEWKAIDRAALYL